MTTEEFVKNLYIEKQSLLELYFNKSGETEVSNLINNLNLDAEKHESLKQIINSVLTDAFYTILIGLDGATGIGNNPQQTFKIYDESGTLISECGELEAEAYEYFHGNKIDIS